MSNETSIENGRLLNESLAFSARLLPRELSNQVVAEVIQIDFVNPPEPASQLPEVEVNSLSPANIPNDPMFKERARPSYANRVRVIDDFISIYQDTEQVQKAILAYRRNTQPVMYDQNSLTQYMRQISKYPLLTKEDEARLFGALDRGVEIFSKLTDRRVPKKFEGDLIDATIAFNKIYLSNLKLVVNAAASKFRKPNSASSEQQDYIQEGNMALGEAIKKFNVSKGYKFSTYATWWLRQRSQRSHAKNGRDFKIPTDVQNEFDIVLAARNEFYEKHHYLPSVNEISQILEKPETEINDLIVSCTREVSSLEEPVEKWGSRELAEVIESPSGIEPFMGHLILRDLIETAIQNADLSRDEMLVLSFRYHIFFPALANKQKLFNSDGHKSYDDVFRSLDSDKTSGFKLLGSLLGCPVTYLSGLEISALRKLRPFVS